VSWATARASERASDRQERKKARASERANANRVVGDAGVLQQLQEAAERGVEHGERAQVVRVVLVPRSTSQKRIPT
jgi:hypothetical protein